jgi:uncharacterized protein (DUF433 family)
MVTLAIEHIVSDPKVRGGRPHIAGTGITVHNLAEDHARGMSVEQMVQAFDLTPGQVHAALSYYFDHQAQIDQEIASDRVRTTELLEELTRQGQAESLADFRRRIETRQARQ